MSPCTNPHRQGHGRSSLALAQRWSAHRHGSQRQFHPGVCQRTQTCGIPQRVAETRTSGMLPHGKLRPHRAYPRRLQCEQRVAGVHLSTVTFGRYGLLVDTLLKRVVGDSADGERVLRPRLGPAAAVTWPKRHVLSKFLCDEPDART